MDILFVIGINFLFEALILHIERFPVHTHRCTCVYIYVIMNIFVVMNILVMDQRIFLSWVRLLNIFP